MLRKDSGSIMIIALIVFSIISTICITCISLTYSNINISSLELKNLQLKENALGAVEIVYGNIKKEIDSAIDNCNNSQEFINYIKKDNYKSFILKCRDISRSELNNTVIELTNRTPFGEIKNFEFEMKVSSKENIYKKQIKVNIRIKNPWNEIDTFQSYKETEEDLEDKMIIINDVENKDLNNINELDIIENYKDENVEDSDTQYDIDSKTDDSENESIESSLEDTKEIFKKDKLITIYNYEEM